MTIPVSTSLPPKMWPKQEVTVYPRFLFFAASISGRRANNHNAVLAGRSGYHCSYVCRRRFTTRTKLSKHVTAAHPDAPFPCQLCVQKFFNETSLNNHMVRQHPDFYQCPIRECRVFFLGQSYYAKHLRTHNVDMCVCYICGEKFGTDSDLDEHSSDHCNESTGFQCYICGLRCRFRSRLNSHVLLHGGFSCNQCGDLFTTARDIRLHTVRCQMLSRRQRRLLWKQRNGNKYYRCKVYNRLNASFLN